MGAGLALAVDVLGHRVHALDLDGAVAWTLERALEGGDDPADAGAACLVVTLNPEIVVRARRDARLAAALAGADLTVADGVGVVWAARRSGVALPGRVPGVELASRVLERGGPRLRVHFVGGRPGVAERAGESAAGRWGVVVAGTHHGYFEREAEGERVARSIGASEPHLVLAGLGEDQETFLAGHRRLLGGGVAIGVGGTLDVLAGEASRTPEWTRRLGLEWAWRVGLDPRRWHRVPRLLEFAALALREGAANRRR